MDYPYEKLEEQLLKLPQDLQQAVTSVHVADTIREIAQENKLLIDQSETFFGLTTYVMLGLLPVKNFKQNLMSELRIPDELASKLILQINERIFVKVRESLQKIQEEQDNAIINEVEKAGNFVVEKEEDPTSSTLTLSNSLLNQAHDAEMLKKDDVIKDIENPPAVKTVDTSIMGFTMKGPIVVQKQVEVKPPQKPLSTPPQSTPKGPDPYREPMV